MIVYFFFCVDFLISDKINVYSEVSMIVGNGYKFIFLLYLNYGYNDKNYVICNLKYIV